MKVIITAEAWRTLEEELDFLIKVRQLPETKALSLGLKLIQRAKSLSKHPYKGQREPFLADLNQEHRRLVEEDFKIIYFISSDVVFITGFYNARRDPDALLR